MVSGTITIIVDATMANYVLMGDVHSVFSRFERALSYIENNIKDFHLVMLGDIFDSRCEESDSISVYYKIRELQNEGKATLIQSNHQWKFQRYLRGNNVKIDDSLQKTIDDFSKSNVTNEELLDWLNSLPFAVSFKDLLGQEYRCAHAYHSSRLYVPWQYDKIYQVKDVSRNMRDKLLYGILDAERIRSRWWEKKSEHDWIRCGGHYHCVSVSFENRSIVLDSCCGDNNGQLSIFDTNNRSILKF